MHNGKKEKKALIVTTVSGFVPQFEMGNVHILQEMGYEIHYASNFNHVNYGSDNHRLDGTGISRHQVDFVRSPFNLRANYKAYQQLKRVMQDDHYDLVHCHTPMGGVLARLAARPHRKQGTKVLYTAHGFHFYKGAPLKNWLLFYPVERFLANYTDVLITINKEDYACAKQFCHKKATQVEYIPGVGIDTEKIIDKVSSVNRNEKRKELGLAESDFVLINVGELNQGKNQKTIIQSVFELKKKYKKQVQVLFCGRGPMQQELETCVKQLGVEQQVKFLGYRTDLYELYAIADCFVFSSVREGLSVSLMEAMAAGLSVVCSRIRGNVDLIENGVGGYLVEPLKIEQYADSVEQLIKMKTNMSQNWEGMGQGNKLVIKKFDKEIVCQRMKKIYKCQVIEEKELNESKKR